MGWKQTLDRLGRNASPWPAFLLLALTVVAPTICVLWFMQQAVESQELAVRQRLHDAYQGQLATFSRRLESSWLAWTERVSQAASRATVDDARRLAAAQFAAIAEDGHVEAAVIVDAEGKLLYPDTLVSSGANQADSNAEWLSAHHLEVDSRDFSAAAVRYSAIVAAATDTNSKARACQAQIRCLMRSGQETSILPLVYDLFSDRRFDVAVDATGRLIAPDLELLCLELTAASPHPLTAEIESRLRARLGDYSTYLAAPQRRFLMKAVRALRPDSQPFVTESAEATAARFAETRKAVDAQPGLRSAGFEGLWQYRIGFAPCVLLMTRERIQNLFQSILRDADLPQDIAIRLTSPDDPTTTDDADMVVAPVGGEFPGWSLSLSLVGNQTLLADTRQRVTAIWWTAILSIAGIVTLAVLVGLMMSRQLATARLKSDLVATVSHELKTPLASMRLLMDTLLDSDRLDEQTTRDYLRLASAENERLSRLIENFLSFSRMEHGRHKFSPRDSTVQEIVDSVCAAAGERFSAADCHFEVRVAARNAQLFVDPDSLVAALLNLLDNAYKFTGEHKQIELAAFVQGARVCFSVADNGIGMSSHTTRRAFEQFYQADRSLARQRSGCGLGLAIVRSIVSGNGGEIDVRSRLGQGTTLTLRFPLVTPDPVKSRTGNEVASS